MALAADALTDYATVAAQLGITGGTGQTLIESLIIAASRALETYTRRKLAFWPGVQEQQPMYGGPQLQIDRTPLLVLQGVTVPFSAPEPANLRIYGWQTGEIWSDVGWPWSALIRQGRYDPNFTFDQQPGTEEKLAKATYAGGYITGPQCYNAAAWPGANKTIRVGTLCKPSSQGDQVWIATPTPNPDGSPTGAALVTSSGEPVWPPSPTPNVLGQDGSSCAFYGGDSVVDGAVTWLFIGEPGAAGARGSAPSLPEDLEQACVIITKWLFRTAPRDPTIKSESLLGASATYELDEESGLPIAAVRLARDYRRVA